jgi:mRNA interferase RelE/StbE
MNIPQAYEVYLERTAEQDLKRLSAKNFQRIIPRIKALAENPRPVDCRKISGSVNDWRIRIGDYRVIYEVKDEGKTVGVMRVRHRREAYR